SALKNVARAPLVIRIDVGMDKADGDRAKTFALNLLCKRLQLRLIERLQFLTVSPDAARDRIAMLARDQRRRQAQIDVVLFEAVFRAHFDDVAKTFAGHESRLCATALNQRVGGER